MPELYQFLDIFQKSIEEFKDVFRSRNLALLSTDYIGSKDELLYQCCACCYQETVRFNNLLQKIMGCKMCAINSRSENT